MKNQQTLLDLERLFADRLHRQIEDISDTCLRADISSSDIVKLVLTSLFFELIQGAVIIDWDEKDFIDSCRLAYRTMMPIIKS